MRYRHENYWSSEVRDLLKKRAIVPYAVVNGYQIYNDTLRKKYCFFTDELGRVERPRNRYARLLLDLADYQKRAAIHFPTGYSYLNTTHGGTSAS
jgi:hypothetical protein